MIVNNRNRSLVESINQNLHFDPDLVVNAEKGDLHAQLKLGTAYYHATCIKNNCYEAFKWLRLSAEQGNEEAQFRLADMYALGHGIEQNLVLAHEWYTKSALRDYPKALVRIHNLYEEDTKLHCRGEIDSEEEGMNEKEFKKENNVRELYEYRLSRLERKLGHTITYFSNRFTTLKESKIKDEDTFHELGFYYQYGYGVRKIAKRAMECYFVSAKQGHTSAQFNLGFLYQHETEIKFNYAHAFKWYMLAAEGGSSQAQNYLAYFYEKGLSVNLDMSRALYWYTQAAGKNVKEASLNIARMYRKGQIDEINYNQSIKWYIIASNQGSQGARNCLYRLVQRMDIHDMDSNVESTLYKTENAVKNRLCSRLQLDIQNIKDTKDFCQLKHLAKNALIGDGNAMLEIGFKYFAGSAFPQDKEIGFKWIKNAARSGLLEAQLIIAKLYEDGKDDAVKQNYYKASIWYFLATKKKNSTAQYKLGVLYYKGHGVRRDPLEASKWFTWSANQGNSDAQYSLGLLRLMGIGLSKDLEEAFEWFTKSAMQKNPKALYQLGKIYWTGMQFEDEKCIKKNEERAILMFTYAANHDSLSAQLLLGRIYEHGEYVEKNVVKSVEYYSLAANLGNVGSKYKLGCMYLNGINVKQDYIKAFDLIYEASKHSYYEAKYLFDTPMIYSSSVGDYNNVIKMFQLAVDGMDADLEYNIGHAYEKGLTDNSGNQVLNSNYYIALEWYERAKKKNDPRAIHRLGKMHEDGKGVAQSMSTAFNYYTLASNLRNPDSTFSLANMYLNGRGVEQDMRKSFYLFFDAANMSHPESRLILAPIFGFNEDDKSRSIYLSVMEMLENIANDGNIALQVKLGDYYISLGDNESAVQWYSIAVEEGITEAYYKLGKIYMEEGFYHNIPKAIKLYEAAMEKNHTESIYEMARAYQYGVGVPQDYLKAFQLYTDASNQGHQRAQRILSITSNSNNTTGDDPANGFLSPSSEDFSYLLSMYESVALDGHIDLQYKIGYVYEKIIESPEYEKAIQWYSMAALGDHKDAEYRLGLLYKNGRGTQQNWSKAKQHFESAIDHGNIGANFEMGKIYHHGNGVQVNESKAIDYYRQAAEQSYSNAEYMMGKLHENGEIIPKDFLEAVRWYKKAYDHGNNFAIIRLYDLQDNQFNERSYNRKSFRILQRFANCHGGKHKNEDPSFYGYMYFRLGYIYLNGLGVKTNYIKAWDYFHIALQNYNNADALYFLTIVKQHLQNSEMLLYNKRIEMLDAVIDKLDKELLYDIAVGYYDQRCLTDCGTPHPADMYYMTIFRYFNKALAKGYLNANKYLGDMYIYGEGVEMNQEKGLECHRDWAQSQSAQENYKTGCEYFEDISNKRRNNSIALVYFENAAQQKVEKAQLYLADMYYYGKGIEQDQERAIEMHKSSEYIRSHWENLLTGMKYYNGDTYTKQNYSIALIYFDISMNQGNNEAFRYLGEMYYYGKGVKEDKEKGLNFHESLLGRQNCDENSTIGFEYLKDNGNFQRNDTIALIYLNAAASYGNSLVKRQLGDMYFYGQGTQENREEALRFHKSYSELHDSIKNKSIGLEYYNGNGDTKTNNSIAFVYIYTASEQGNIKAQLILGDMYYYGLGVEEDHKKALSLYKSIAEQQGSSENVATGLQYYNGNAGIKRCIEAAYIFFDRVVLQENNNNIRFIADIIYDKGNIQRDVKKAVRYYNISAHQQSIDINSYIGSQYYNGSNGTKKDESVAQIFFNKAADQKNIKIKRELADDMYFKSKDAQSKKKAIEYHQECANWQHNKTNLFVGLQYYKYDDDTEESNTIALIYITQATSQGNNEAKRYLGDMHYNGHGVKKDREKAIELYKSVSDKLGIIENMNIGLQYYNDSTKSKRDYIVSLLFLDKLPYDENFNAQRYLADRLYYGKDIEENREMAIQLYKASTSAFSDTINFSIGEEYYYGSEEVQISLSIAFIYISEAATQGHRDAQLRLGHMYYFGIGAEKDHPRAIELFKLCADQFDNFDNTRIGLEYYESEKNLLIAFIFLLKAADQGNTIAQEYVSNI